MFAKPEIGTNVKVITDWSGFYTIRKYNTVIGEVAKGENFDDPNSFRVATDNPNYPISIIALKQIIELVDINSAAEMDPNAVSDEIKNESWSVDGSKGKVYTVTVKDDVWSCSCPGFGFRRQCKHVNAKKES